LPCRRWRQILALPNGTNTSAHFRNMCCLKLWNVKITAEVREYAAGMSENERTDLEKQAAVMRCSASL